MINPDIDPAVLIRDVNASNEEVENQCLRARRAADIAMRSACAADQATSAARAAEAAYETVQAEHPQRYASQRLRPGRVKQPWSPKRPPPGLPLSVMAVPSPSMRGSHNETSLVVVTMRQQRHERHKGWRCLTPGH